LTLAGRLQLLATNPYFSKVCLSKIVALSKYPDIHIEIFEAANKLAEIGAGIGFFSREVF
jgi:hypothetical protein